MAYLIGIDEAGYGPNLGPLVIAATCWEVAAGVIKQPLDKLDLYSLLAKGITRDAKLAASHPKSLPFQPLAIADSKTLFKPGGGLGRLARTVLSSLSATGKTPTTWRALLADLHADPKGTTDSIPWYQGYDVDILSTKDKKCQHLQTAGDWLANNKQGIHLKAVRARAIFAEEFNTLCDLHGNKAAALTLLSLALLGDVLDSLESRKNETFVVFDKHGGRKFYASALQRQFPDSLIAIRQEEPQESQYTFKHHNGNFDVRFRKGGEAFLPTALASMTAKYVRELSMQVFNAFWCGRIDGLKATAGYPVDAKRFRKAIASLQAELGIGDSTLWRMR